MKPIPMAAILAGGKGRRMGADKAVLPLQGMPLIERAWQRVSAVSESVVVVGGEPRLDHRGVETIPDRYPGANAMGGIATALIRAASLVGPEAWALCVACDMPFLEPEVLAYLARWIPNFDIVVPHTGPGYEPLCAIYRATCLPAFDAEIGRGNLRIFDLYDQVRTHVVREEELRKIDPELASFLNLNRPEDLETARRLLGAPA